MGSSSIRKGFAAVYAGNIRLPEFNQYCTEQLINLFNDPEEEVRAKAAQCFSTLKKADEFTQNAELLKAFITSPSYEKNYSSLLYWLKDYADKLPDVVCLACERFFDVVGYEASDISQGAAALADTVSKLIVRLYTHTSDETIKCKCLDLIDRMMQLGVYGVGSVMEKYERA